MKKQNAKKKQNQLNKRIQIITELGFKFDEETAIYTRGDDDIISYEVLENLSKENFVSLVLSFQLNDDLISKQPTIDYKIEEPDVEFMDIPLFKTPNLETIVYTITGTSKQIENLNRFLKDNNIKYK